MGDVRRIMCMHSLHAARIIYFLSHCMFIYENMQAATCKTVWSFFFSFILIFFLCCPSLFSFFLLLVFPWIIFLACIISLFFLPFHFIFFFFSNIFIFHLSFSFIIYFLVFEGSMIGIDEVTGLIHMHTWWCCLSLTWCFLLLASWLLRAVQGNGRFTFMSDSYSMSTNLFVL